MFRNFINFKITIKSNDDHREFIIFKNYSKSFLIYGSTDIQFFKPINIMIIFFF